MIAAHPRAHLRSHAFLILDVGRGAAGLQRSYFSFLLVHGGFARYGKLGVPFLTALKNMATHNRVDLTPFKEILKVRPCASAQRLSHTG